MAVNHIDVNTNKRLGAQLIRARNVMEEATTLMDRIRDTMTLMIDGADHTYLENQFGLPTGKGAAAYAEVQAVMACISVNSSVSNVKQVLNSFQKNFAAG